MNPQQQIRFNLIMSFLQHRPTAELDLVFIEKLTEFIANGGSQIQKAPPGLVL
jgi:hypothetical protein